MLEIQRQQALAQALQQQAFDKIDYDPRGKIAPTQGLQKIAAGLMGGMAQNKAINETRDLSYNMTNAQRAAFGLPPIVNPNSPSPQALGNALSGQPQQQQAIQSAQNNQVNQSAPAQQVSGGYMPKVTGNPNQDAMLYMMSPEAFTKGAVDMATAGPIENAKQNVTPHEVTLSDGSKTYLPQSQINMMQPPALKEVLATAAQQNGVPPDLAHGVMMTESGGNPGAVSPKGAMGPMQLMPQTAQGLGVNPQDPVQNIQGGVKYLKENMDRYGNPTHALMAYNWGPGNVDKWLANGADPKDVPKETKDYIANVSLNAAKPQQQTQAPLHIGQSSKEAAAAKATGEKQPEMTVDTQEVSGKAAQMREAVKQMITEGEELKKKYPLSSPSMLGARESAGRHLPGAGTDVNTAYSKINELGATTLLPMIKAFLQGTGQVRVFEGENFEEISKWDESQPIESNIEKLKLLLPQIDNMEKGAYAKLDALHTGQAKPYPEAPAPTGAVNLQDLIAEARKRGAVK